MKYKQLIQILGFKPKENTVGIFQKKYAKCGDYSIEIDVEKEYFNFGDKIKVENKVTSNFLKAENWVVLECVNRLLEKGYQPQNITLEKTWKTGHGTSGRLDILVSRDNGSAYLMIECKNWGAEFDKEFKNLERDGGQLFSYFQQDKDAEILMLYASQLQGGNIEFKNVIIKIEDAYRQTGNIKDFYQRWNKQTVNHGIWENPPYNFQTLKFTKNQLVELNEEAGKNLFHGFASILRKHAVSDKPNAFNVIFNLFLAKLYDEQKRPTDELEFHWRENDDPIDFQVRLYNLHKAGLYDFLKKEIEGIEDSDFKTTTAEELRRVKKKILKFNKLFDIKSVLDDTDFEQNHRVLKEVVQLIEKYQIRYPRKQRYLSDFFELLLTTGLKQEVGQYFTPPPIAKFIIKSLPIQEMMVEQLNQPTPSLPAVIDYAAGSGHFITEIMEEFQEIINDKIDTSDFYPKAKEVMNAWKVAPYSWASKYMYGIEKDYRLVKVAKVGCYFYGDGLAQIIHGNGLDSFASSKSYVGLLKENTNLEDSSKAKFSIVVSNPPYTVPNCKDDLEYINSQGEFSLYSSLTDKSKEIESLFVERTKQLLKDGGIAGIILPNSILNKEGIYTRTREIILKYFEILAIAEMGSNTFMATTTNTVILFLRRRNNTDAFNIEEAVKKYFINLQDVTINSIEKPVSKYVAHAWEGITYEDYKTLLQKAPNDNIKQHDIYQTYQKKIKAKTDKERWATILTLEQEKLTYFIIAYPQRLVLVKTGSKKEEKRFLGYEFSNRRGGEGIHPIQRSKTIDECTKLYDAESFTNPEKASTYIYKAFNGEFDLGLPENLQQNISYQNLVDMLTFDRVDFDKSISLAPKKKVRFESQWNLERISNIAILNPSKSELSSFDDNLNVSYIEMASVSESGVIENRVDKSIGELRKGSYKYFRENDILIAKITPCMENGKCAIATNLTNGIGLGSSEFHVIRTGNKLIPKYLFSILNRKNIRDVAESNMTGTSGHRRVPEEFYSKLKIPVPPKEIQQKIVAEIKDLEKQEQKGVEQIDVLHKSIYKIINPFPKDTLSKHCEISTDKENPQSNVSKKYKYIGLEHIESNSGKIAMNTEIGGNILSTKNKFNAGDILYGKLRPYLNKVAVPDFDGICSTDIVVLKSDISYILKYVLRSEEFVEQTSQVMSGVSLPRIKAKDLLSLKVPIPPSSEQDKVISDIKKIEQKITKLEKQIQSIPEQKEAILKKYL